VLVELRFCARKIVTYFRLILKRYENCGQKTYFPRNASKQVETNAYSFFGFDGFIYIASPLNQLDTWFIRADHHSREELTFLCRTNFFSAMT